MTAWRFWSVCLSAALCACQPTVNQNMVSSSSPSDSPVQSETTRALKVLPAHCENIPLQMSAITDQSDLRSLQVVNQALKKCVAEVDDVTRHQWMQDSHKMYQRFLTLNDQTGIWDEFSWTLEGHDEETPEERQERLQRQKELWPKLTKRMKQLSPWLGQEYIDNFYIGEGMMHLRRSPKYLLDIFAPHLPEDERVFMQQLGQDNLTLTTNDAAIVVAWPELAKRALFWEQYSSRFPKSAYALFAKYQFEWYRAALFLGSDNTPFIDGYGDQLFIVPDALQTHQQLATQNPSSLSKKSQIVLKWIEEYESQWPQLTESERQAAQEKLNKDLKINYPDALEGKEKNSYYNCSSDAVCHLESWT